MDQSGPQAFSSRKAQLTITENQVHVSWEVQQAIVDAGLQSALQVVLFHPRAVHSTYQQQVPNDCGGYDRCLQSFCSHGSCSLCGAYHGLITAPPEI